MPFRLIPRLDVKGENLVKGIHLEGLRILGSPDIFAEIYAAGGADEILYVDAVASLYGRNNLLNLVSRTAEKLFIPITVGGGIRSEDDVYYALEAGADKVAINTAALEDPPLLDRIARRFGASTLVVSLQGKKLSDGRYVAYMNNGRDSSRRDLLEWLDEAVSRGAGEILLTSVDREGTGAGFDLDLAEQATSRAPVPVIICGGAGNLDHLVAAAQIADAVAVASLLHYFLVERLATEQRGGSTVGDFRVIENRPSQAGIAAVSLEEAKSALERNGYRGR